MPRSKVGVCGHGVRVTHWCARCYADQAPVVATGPRTARARLTVTGADGEQVKVGDFDLAKEGSEFTAIMSGLKDGVVEFTGDFVAAPRDDTGLDMVEVPEVLTVTSSSAKALRVETTTDGREMWLPISQLSFAVGHVRQFSNGARLMRLRMPRWLADQHHLEYTLVARDIDPRAKVEPYGWRHLCKECGAVSPPFERLRDMEAFAERHECAKERRDYSHAGECKVCGAPPGDTCAADCDGDEVPDRWVKTHPKANRVSHPLVESPKDGCYCGVCRHDRNADRLRNSAGETDEERNERLAGRARVRAAEETPSLIASLPEGPRPKPGVLTTDEATLADLLCEEVP